MLTLATDVSCVNGALTNALHSIHSTKKIMSHSCGQGLIKRGLFKPSFFGVLMVGQHLQAKPVDANLVGNLARFSRTREQGASKIKP